MKWISYLGLCLYLFLLGACAATQAETPSDGTFTQTGLTVYKGERPEEILLRAHEGDMRAIALVVAGYSFGMEGFPRDEYLATNWRDELYWYGAIRTATFLLTMKEMDTALADRNASRAATCEFGKKSPVAPLFSKAGIFDIKNRCQLLASAPVEKSDTWLAEYQKTETYWNSIEKARTLEISMMRELRTRPTTQAEAHAIRAVITGYHSQLRDIRRFLFYAATTHDLEDEPPNWNDTHLMALMALKKGVLLPLHSRIEKAILLHATFEPSLPLEIIRRAHEGESKAMLAMARNYAAGEMGFPPSLGLSLYWLLRAR